MPKDSHRKHQQLMTNLSLLNTRIKAHEHHLRKLRGKVAKDEWERAVRELKALNHKKSALNRELRGL